MRLLRNVLPVYSRLAATPGKTPWAMVIGVAACVLLGSGVARAQDPCAPTATLPPVTLTQGEYFFRVDTKPTLLLGTNPWAPTTADFAPLLAGAGVNDKVVRLFVHSLRQSPTFAGNVDEAWASNWDDVLCDAQANGLYVLLVLDVWPNWNDVAVPALWAASIYNVNSTNPGCTNGALVCGPAVDPSELLQPGATQDAWLTWVAGVVSRLKAHTNILGYEIFSEIDNMVDADNTPADQTLFPCAMTLTNLPLAVCLMESAAARIRATDPGRPLTASVKGVNDWVSLSTSSLDFLQVHPYTDTVPIDGGNLDQAILDQVRLRRATYGKPVFIGESGLDQIFPDVNALTINARGWIGINQAIWAGAVAGSMNARMLWYEDGYDNDSLGRVNLCGLGLAHYNAEQVCLDGGILTLHEVYQSASLPVKNFLVNVDYSGFEPGTLTPVSANLMGAALGNDTDVIGWVRDVLSTHDETAADPYWPWRLLSGESVTVGLPRVSADWIVDFYDTTTGDKVASIDADQDVNGAITFTLPDFEGSIAFQIHAVPPLEVTIDIRPARRINIIIPGQLQPLPVAIISTDDFYAGTVDISSIRFGPAGAAPVANRLLNADGDNDMDLVLLFRPRDTGLACGDEVATLTGETTSGRSFVGTDSVKIVGTHCPP
jgi:hypothetical protein